MGLVLAMDGLGGRGECERAGEGEGGAREGEWEEDGLEDEGIMRE